MSLSDEELRKLLPKHDVKQMEQQQQVEAQRSALRQQYTAQREAIRATQATSNSGLKPIRSEEILELTTVNFQNFEQQNQENKEGYAKAKSMKEVAKVFIFGKPLFTLGAIGGGYQVMAMISGMYTGASSMQLNRMMRKRVAWQAVAVAAMIYDWRMNKNVRLLNDEGVYDVKIQGYRLPYPIND